MKILRLFTFIFMSTVLMSNSCGSGSTSVSEEGEDKQGIEGKVLWVEGNLMPGPDMKPVEPQPVKREVLIYEVTHSSKAKNASNAALYSQVNSKLVKSVTSSEDGTFKADLPPGKYSIFTKEKNGLFANGFDGEGHIHTVEVKKGIYTPLTITINYAAVY